MMEHNNSENQRTRKLQSVRRKLFMDDNDDDDNVSSATEENLANRLIEEVKEDMMKMAQKWNFDFINGRPLPGPWEYVRPDEEFSDNSKTDEKSDNSNKNINNVANKNNDNQLTEN